MASKNDITGDTIATRVPSKLYEQNYDLIFRSKPNEASDNSDEEKWQQECEKHTKTM